MGKHVYTAFVLVCTLSTRVGETSEETPVEETSLELNKKLPGFR